MAAVALTHGWADPLALLDLQERDARIAGAIVRRADERRADLIVMVLRALGVDVHRIPDQAG